jgi:hypothetical protein
MGSHCNQVRPTLPRLRHDLVRHVAITHDGAHVERRPRSFTNVDSLDVLLLAQAPFVVHAWITTRRPTEAGRWNHRLVHENEVDGGPVTIGQCAGRLDGVLRERRTIQRHQDLLEGSLDQEFLHRSLHEGSDGQSQGC